MASIGSADCATMRDSLGPILQTKPYIQIMDFVGMAADTDSVTDLLKSAWTENSQRKKQVSDWMRRSIYACSG
jgi:hypothetical protein